MNSPKIKRKLTTIFCADVQSYSTLMADDESDTLQRLQRYRAIMSDLFERHEGRKVNTWGDAVIAEFASVVEAVRCAVEIQDAVGAENRDLPKPRQMWFRIGINLGDVMQDGSDLYGDGVNVAARLESIAEPGGIMVSKTVFELTHRQLAFGYDFAGEQKVKGQDAPIPSYRVRMQGRNIAVREPAQTDDGSGRASSADRDEDAGADASAMGDPGIIDRWGERIVRFRAWYARQPRKTRVPVAIIGSLAALNLVTTGMSDLWFIIPSAPFAAYLLFQKLTARKS